MSGVYARRRKLSEYEFVANARKIKVEVNRLVLNEKYVPKRYRFTNAVPAIDAARGITRNLNMSARFYPNTAANVIERRKHLSLALAECDNLMDELQDMIDLGLGLKDALRCDGDQPNRLEALVEMVDREISLITGAKKNVRLVGKRSLDEMIGDAEGELLRLLDAKAGQSEEPDGV